MTAYRLTTLPVTSMPWPSKTAFAISRPIVELALHNWLLRIVEP